MAEWQSLCLRNIRLGQNIRAMMGIRTFGKFGKFLAKFGICGTWFGGLFRV